VGDLVTAFCLTYPGVETAMPDRERRMPAWVLGLLIAILVFAVVMVAFSLLGIGDDPVIESISRLG
jgi:hypothetical protein